QLRMPAADGRSPFDIITIIVSTEQIADPASERAFEPLNLRATCLEHGAGVPMAADDLVEVVGNPGKGRLQQTGERANDLCVFFGPADVKLEFAVTFDKTFVRHGF